MKPNIFTDLAAGVKAVRTAHDVRKNGVDVQIRVVKRIPVLETSRWLETIEGWNIFTPLDNKELREAVRAVYYDLDDGAQRSLMRSPVGPGAWLERARFWKATLKPALPPKLYRLAIEYILDWYVHRFTRRPTLHIATTWDEPQRFR